MRDAAIRLLCTLLCAGLLCSGVSCKPKTLTEDDFLRLAGQFTGYFTGGKPAEAVKLMDATMRGAMPEAATAEYFAGMVQQLGEFKSVLRSRYVIEGGYNIVYVMLLFANAEIEMKVVFDKIGKVAGLWFGAPQLPGSADYTPPPYADAAKFVETEVVIGSGQWQLPGTLTMPRGDGPFPAVVLVHGSGAHDRDEALGPNRPFKDLAWGLASQGVAVLRYDKRTKVYPAQAAADEGFTVKDEAVDDAVAAVALLRATAKIDPAGVFVAGHSLGAMMAPRIAGELTSGAGGVLAGVIMLAAPARGLLELVLEQSEYLAKLDGEVSEAEAAQLAALQQQVEAIRQGGLKAGEAALGAYQAYWTDLMAHDHVATAKGLTVPVLLLQGERDYQVTMADFSLWQEHLAGRAHVTLKSYPGLNHLFMRGEGTPGPAEYSTPGNVAQDVVDDIARWIKGR